MPGEAAVRSESRSVRGGAGRVREGTRSINLFLLKNMTWLGWVGSWFMVYWTDPVRFCWTDPAQFSGSLLFFFTDCANKKQSFIPPKYNFKKAIKFLKLQ